MAGLKHDTVTPYGTSAEKKEQVEQMFDNIAPQYDLLNSILSLRIHKSWRKKCVNILKPEKPSSILDVATGTGDFAIACAELNPKKITGIDISEGMMKVGREKLRKLKLDQLITLQHGDAESVSLPDNSYDAIVVGFGVRNFQNLENGLKNLHRILKPGGTLLVLEFSYPKPGLFRMLYEFYSRFITPTIGKIFSKDKRAYTYLTESVKAFPHNEDFVNLLNHCGYKSTSFKALTLGISSIYIGKK